MREVIEAGDMAHAEAPRVLICHGDADPFISLEGRAAWGHPGWALRPWPRCEEQLRKCGARWDRRCDKHGMSGSRSLSSVFKYDGYRNIVQYVITLYNYIMLGSVKR